MNKDFRVAPKISPVISRNIALAVYHYINNKNTQRYIDRLRGSLDVGFDLDLISIDAFIFLNNFCCWLENKYQFNGKEENMCSIFYDEYVKKLDIYLEM